MKHRYLLAGGRLAAGLSAGCSGPKYVLAVYSTRRYDALALPLAADMRLTTVGFVSAREGYAGGAYVIKHSDSSYWLLGGNLGFDAPVWQFAGASRRWACRSRPG